MPKEKSSEPGSVMPEPGISREEWQAKNWPGAEKNVTAAFEKAWAEKHRGAANRHREIGEEGPASAHEQVAKILEEQARGRQKGFRPIVGPEGDNDPATAAWRSEHWEKDEKRAEVMAHAGHKYRSRAAEIRDTNKDIGSEFGKRLSDHNDDMASHLEREAGREFDEERQAAERVIGQTESNPRTAIEPEESEEEEEEREEEPED